MADQPPLHVFDTRRAKRYLPCSSFEKTAILVEIADPAATTVVQTPFGEQTLQGSFYAIAEGSSSYGASRSEFEETHRQTGPSRWVKNQAVLAYPATEPCRVETYIAGKLETTVTAQADDWIVQQVTGEVMVIGSSDFQARYERA